MLLLDKWHGEKSLDKYLCRFAIVIMYSSAVEWQAFLERALLARIWLFVVVCVFLIVKYGVSLNMKSSVQ